MELTFGKFKGKKIDEIVESEKFYCIWLMNSLRERCSPEMLDYLDQNLQTNIIDFGKYKYKSLHEIKQIDAAYLKWLISLDKISTKPFYRPLLEILKG